MAYIERDKVVELIKNYGKGAIEDGLRTLDPVDDIVFLAKGVDLIPTADEVEVRHGEWVEDGYYDNPCVCSYCGAEAMHNNRVPKEYIRTPYCPNCGAKMDGGK